MIACAVVIPRTLPPFLFVLRISKSPLENDFRYSFGKNLYLSKQISAGLQQNTGKRLHFVRHCSDSVIKNVEWSKKVALVQQRATTSPTFGESHQKNNENRQGIIIGYL